MISRLKLGKDNIRTVKKLDTYLKTASSNIVLDVSLQTRGVKQNKKRRGYTKYRAIHGYGEYTVGARSTKKIVEEIGI